MSELTTIVSVSASTLITVITLVLNFRTRKDPFVRHLMERKTRAYDALLNALGSWVGTLLDVSAGWVAHTVVPEPGESIGHHAVFRLVNLKPPARERLDVARRQLLAVLVAESPYLPARIGELVRLGVQEVDNMTATGIGDATLPNLPGWLQDIIDIVRNDMGLKVEAAEKFVDSLLPKA